MVKEEPKSKITQYMQPISCGNLLKKRARFEVDEQDTEINLRKQFLQSKQH